MSVVKGFTDVLQPVNFATNGSFTVNQRNAFNNAFAAAKVGDYVCDAWKIESSTMDSLEAFCGGYTNWGISFQGYGKRGQRIKLRSSDNTPNAAPHSQLSYVDRTAAVLVSNNTGTVPIKAYVAPRVHQNDGEAGLITWNLDKSVIKSGTFRNVVCIVNTSIYIKNIYAGGFIIVELAADGYFNFTLREYREMYGAYVNPPSAPVNYADDLLRCKRYYQSGTLRNEPTSRSLFFPVEMAGSPTIEIKNGSVLLGAASWDEVLPRSVSYSDPKGFQSYRYLSMAVSGSGSITRYVTSMSQATLSVKLGTPTNSVSSTYGTASNSSDAVSTNPMLLGSGSNGTPGTRSVAITEISSTKITVTYTNAVAGDNLYLWVSGADAGATENCHYWTATV